MKQREKLKNKIWDMKLNLKFTLVIILFAVGPIAVLSGVLFYNMEQSTVQENLKYMEYTSERNKDQILTNLASINMSTQFFLSDSTMLEVLNYATEGRKLTTKELVDFHDSDVAALERLVNNNPLLYCVRIYSCNDNVQEMMPVLYNNSRMRRLEWFREGEEQGWHYNYNDSIFSSLMINREKKILSLVTPIVDYENGTIGYVEAAMAMETMFPGLYEQIENEWSCFVTEAGIQYFGDNEQAESKSIVTQVLDERADTEETEVYYTSQKGRKLIVSYMPLKELGGTLVSVQDITRAVGHVYTQRNGFVVVMILILLALAVVIDALVKHMLKQFYVIQKTVSQVQDGNLQVRIEQMSHDEMGELGKQLNFMLDKIEKLMADNINRELLAKNSEIRALQNQINAHFIYNVLESIKMMAEIEEMYQISDAITSLGKLLRYSMKWVSGNVTVAEELEYIKNYMVLINLRYDYEIVLSINMPEVLLSQEIPKMSLQPIVENAILHGIEEMAEDTSIYIKGIVEKTNCRIEITDTGKGMTVDEIERIRLRIEGAIDASGGKQGGIGLKNVQDRIVLAFGQKYGLDISAREGAYTKVSVRIPLRSKEV